LPSLEPEPSLGCPGNIKPTYNKDLNKGWPLDYYKSSNLIIKICPPPTRKVDNAYARSDNEAGAEGSRLSKPSDNYKIPADGIGRNYKNEHISTDIWNLYIFLGLAG